MDHNINDKVCEHKNTIIQLEENDAVSTALAYFKYFQCLTIVKQTETPETN